MKILFICSNLIGDTILSSGVINYFVDQNKDAKLTFVVGQVMKKTQGKANPQTVNKILKEKLKK